MCSNLAGCQYNYPLQSPIQQFNLTGKPIQCSQSQYLVVASNDACSASSGILNCPWPQLPTFHFSQQFTVHSSLPGYSLLIRDISHALTGSLTAPPNHQFKDSRLTCNGSGSLFYSHCTDCLENFSSIVAFVSVRVIMWLLLSHCLATCCLQSHSLTSAISSDYTILALRKCVTLFFGFVHHDYGPWLECSSISGPHRVGFSFIPCSPEDGNRTNCWYLAVLTLCARIPFNSYSLPVT
jgi:hypothetical protein